MHASRADLELSPRRKGNDPVSTFADAATGREGPGFGLGVRRPEARSWTWRPASRCWSDQLKFCCDVDRAFQAARDGAEAGVERVHSFGLFASLVGNREPITHVDAFDNEHALLGLDLADRLDVVPVRIDFDLARFQRAGERAR